MKKKHHLNLSRTPANEKGIIGEYFENDLPVIVKFINEFPNKSARRKFPTMVVGSWKYDGRTSNEMPLKELNERMRVMETALEGGNESNIIHKHAYSRTGNNLKELVYYTTNQDDFMQMLNRALLNHERYPVEINFYPDAEWSEFKSLLTDFELEK